MAHHKTIDSDLLKLCDIEKLAASFPVWLHLSDYLKEHGKLSGKTVGWHCHLTSLTAVMAQVIVESGAKLFLSECNSSTTDAAAVAYMNKYGATIYLGTDSCRQVLSHKPSLICDTGLALIETYLQSKSSFVFAGSEITASGINKLHQLANLPFPIININQGQLKAYIENYHGVGTGVVQALNMLCNNNWQNKQCAVVGYGNVGAGVARYLQQTGAQVSIVEKNAARALIAHYDGFPVLPLKQALSNCQLIVTATGSKNLLSKDAWLSTADNLLVFNVGHDKEEIDLPALKELSVEKTLSPHLKEYSFNNKRIIVAADGNPINIVLLTGDNAPTLIHLTTEILCLNYLAACLDKGLSLPAAEIDLPEAVEETAAHIALNTLGIKI